VARGGLDSLDTLRIVLTADLLRRVLEELHGLQAAFTLADPGCRDRDSGRAFARRLGRFWITTPSLDDAVPVGVPLIFVSDVSASDGPTTQHNAVAHLSVGPVLASAPLAPDDNTCLAIRFVLLDSHYSQPVSLTAETVARARVTIERWRRRISGWGHHPSVPMPRDVAARCAAALEDNLDTPRLISVLCELEDDPAVQPGAKFATFLHVDRYLAVDLARDLGTGASVDPLSGG
jgi:hypothetical protein